MENRPPWGWEGMIYDLWALKAPLLGQGGDQVTESSTGPTPGEEAATSTRVWWGCHTYSQAFPYPYSLPWCSPLPSGSTPTHFSSWYPQETKQQDDRMTNDKTNGWVRRVGHPDWYVQSTGCLLVQVHLGPKVLGACRTHTSS